MAPISRSSSSSAAAARQATPIKTTAADTNSHKLSLSPTTTTTPKTTTSLQDMTADAAAIALDMKPTTKLVDMAQTQKIKKLVRRNASDKLKLIQMVHDNPILWDSRLPNFKGAEEEKNRAWEHIGKEFNAPGRRVARAFKSLRESYRRELAHVKIMGNGFKPKWSLYEAMDFLRDVIRERKGGAHAADPMTLGLNLTAFATHHLHHNGNNNNNNNNHNNNNNNNNNHHNSSKSSLKLNGTGGGNSSTCSNNGLQSSFNDSALNLSKCSSLSPDDYYYFVKPELDLSTGNNITSAHQPMPAHQTQLQHTNHPLSHHHNHHHHLNQNQQQQQTQEHQQNQQHSQHNDSRVTSTRNDTNTTQHNSNSTYDDLDASSLRSGDDDAGSLHHAPLSHEECSDEVEELEAIDADFPYPLILDSNSPTSASIERENFRNGGRKRRRHQLNDDLEDGSGGIVGNDDADADDDYEDQMLQQHRHLRQQQNGGSISGLDMPPPQTVREVLNSKFCGFISAKLNSMEDSEADNLMNRILMLLVQTQVNNETK